MTLSRTDEIRQVASEWEFDKRIHAPRAAMAAVATNEGKPEESAPWATILLAARRLETGKLTGDAQ